ncbi:MAG: tryptophan synthase subunit alpha [Synergistales bacterium]|nr:tryptophan synthase subunit alpha [Synergistales bacterium]MDY6400795.1 tryptophan synthase subunit alpha [Synergistales bacterium]MDY6403983.1 tryptophan synthase subunit alpha [Synergistales bacterium]MDY6410450.1 tryptophan synthase subunit alpha [Synergistales bacterium]MDY6414588.1 tryptophan synthase subunit alpha [Synergistales bacterium]
MSALVETHDENEIKTALKAGAKIISVNNRNLKDFSVDTENSKKLRSLISNENRIAMIAQEAKGFLYIVSSLGVTGTRSKRTTDLAKIVEAVRKNSDIPCSIGFGISTPEQAKKMADISDGAIIGSAIIKILEKYGTDAPSYIGEYVKSMKQGVMS